MRALTVVPGQAGSAALTTLAEPVPDAGELLVDGLALGICATDREIVAGEYGSPAPGRRRLILGHESLGRVRAAPPGTGFAAGDLVVGMVRRPDPHPCGACAHGEFDMCRNGEYTERGIRGRDGYGAERWTVEADYAMKLDPALERIGVLIEPTSIVAKAWEHAMRIGGRAPFAPRRALVIGAGPIGLLAALLGVQRGLEVHVLDRVTGGLKPKLVEALDATYHPTSVATIARDAAPDIVIEATGVGKLVFDAIEHVRRGGIVCLAGVSPRGQRLTVDAGALNRTLVLERAEQLHATVAQIRDLPDQQRTALLWHALEGRTYQSIAAQLMITPGAAHQLVHRARVRLRAGVSVLTPPAPLARLIELVRRAFESVPGGGRVIAATGAAVLAATAGVVATLPPADSAGVPRHRPPAAGHDVWAPTAPSPLSSVVIERRLRDPVHARPRHRVRRSPDRRPHRVAGAGPARPASSRATTSTAAAASPPATPASNEPSAGSVPTAPATSAPSSPSREEDAAHNKESSPAPAPAPARAPAPAPAPAPDAGDSGDGDGG